MAKAYLDAQDIKERYGCGLCKAYSIIRGIRDFNGGGALGPGKVLVSELEYWETNRGGQERRTNTNDT